MTSADVDDWKFYTGLAVRLVVLILILLAAVYMAGKVKTAIGFEVMPHNEAWMHKMILLGLLAYIVLTALPFVPGAEIGMTLLTVFGAQMAPFIYLATLMSLSLAYCAGLLVSLDSAARLARGVRLERLAGFLDRLSATPRHNRPQMLVDESGHPTLSRLARFRYVALAILINIPGNSIVGGGGGMSFVAGLSGVFPYPRFLLTIAIAVLPVPLAVFAFGV